MRDEDGTTVAAPNEVWTGCKHDGTEKTRGGMISLGLGSSAGVTLGIPNSTESGTGPISSLDSVVSSVSRPMYALSGVFQVSANTPATGTVTINGTPQVGEVLTAESPPSWTPRA